MRLYPHPTMNLLHELDRQLLAMQLPQLLLLLVFLGAYVAAIGRLLGPRGRVRAGALAALAAVGLCVAIRPWTVGVLLVAGSVAAVGAYVLATMILWRVLEAAAARQRALAPAEPARHGLARPGTRAAAPSGLAAALGERARRQVRRLVRQFSS